MSVVIVDALATRRSAYESLLEGWANQNGFSLISVADEAQAKLVTSKVALTLVVLGSEGLASFGARARLERITRDTEGAVAAVVEYQSPDCAAVAFDLHLKGVLCVAESPAVIRAALSFIVAGGCYIPHVRSNRTAFPEMSYLPKSVTADQTPVSPMTADGGVDASESHLTQRQHDVLRSLLNGASNKEIARLLNLSEATVKTHIRQVMRKLNAGNRTQAAILGRNLRQVAMSGNPVGP